jgi:hypothetical protein
MSLQPNRIFVDEAREIEESDPEDFDRVAFALDAVRALAPRRLTVAVYPRRRGLFVEAVKDWRRGECALWVTLGVPPRASRAQIAHALASAAGIESQPYTLDVLVNADRNTI